MCRIPSFPGERLGSRDRAPQESGGQERDSRPPSAIPLEGEGIRVDALGRDPIGR